MVAVTRTKTHATLDVSSLPGGQTFESVDLGKLFDEKLRPVISSLITYGLIKDVASFGFAMAAPNFRGGISSAWNDPARLVWMTAGWGPDEERYIANAVRKLRAAARLGIDSIGLKNTPGFVDNEVKSVEDDGTFRWGDFPYGGAVWVGPLVLDGYTFLGAISALTQEEDHVSTQLVLDVFQLEIHKAKKSRNPAP